jgi:predicted ATPase
MHLKTLGGLQLVGGELTRAKPLLVLAYLALEGGATRGELSRLFFQSAKDARDSVSTAIGRLRQALAEHIVVDGDRVHTTVPCDAVEVLRLFEAGATRAAVDAYGGAFLKGLDVSVGLEIEEWVYGTREAIAAGVRSGLGRLAVEAVARRDFADAGRLAERAYLVPGAPEPDPETLMHLHSILLAAGHRLERDVRAEAVGFGAEVVTSREEAIERLGGGRIPVGVGSGTVPANNLPSPTTTFLGRDLELAELTTMVERDDVRLLTLRGAGGTGKTRLAVEIARNQLVRPVFRDGVHLVRLEYVPEPALVMLAVAEVVGLDVQGPESPVRQVERFIGDRSMLLVLDDLDHLVEAARDIATLLAACPNLTVLATSRERLNVQGEWLVPIDGLTFAPRGVAGDIARHYDAVRLFELRAQQHDRAFRMTDDVLPHVLRICRAVDGLPLGLELAATWVRHMRVDEIADDVERGAEVLRADLRDLPERHRSLRATFERSWRLLDEHERIMLRSLSVFRGGFRREAAGAVAGATLPDLARLVDKSMLRGSPTGRYDRHPQLLQFMVEDLERDPSELARLRAAHAEYYLRFLADRTGELIGGPRIAAAVDAVAEEFPNIRVAWEWAIEHRRPEVMIDALEGLTHFAELTASQVEVLNMLHAALEELAPDGPEAALAIASVKAILPILLYRVGDNQAAREHALAALAALEAIERPARSPHLWAAHYGLGSSSLWSGACDVAPFERAVAVAREDLERSEASCAAPDVTRRAEVLLGVAHGGAAMAEVYRGNLAAAQEHLDQGRHRLERIGSPYVSFLDWVQHDVELASGRLAEARRWLDHGTAMARDRRYATELTTLELCDARLALLSGDCSAAAAKCGELASGIAVSGDQYAGSVLATLEGWIALHQGRAEEALRAFRSGIEQARSIGSNALVMEPLLGVSQVLAATGRASDALIVLEFLRASPMAAARLSSMAAEAIEQLRSSDPRSAEDPSAAVAAVPQQLSDVLAVIAHATAEGDRVGLGAGTP